MKAILFATVLANGMASLQAADFPRALFSLEHPKTGPEHVIKVQFGGAAPVNLGEGEPLNPKSYELRVMSDGQESAVAIASVRAVSTNAGFSPTFSIRAHPGHTLSVSNKYALRIKPGKVFIKAAPAGTAPLNANENRDLSLDENDININESFIKPKGKQNKLEILGGTGGGDGSFRFAHRFNELRGRGWLNLEAEVKGDFNFQSENKDEYFNNFTGELKFYYPFRWNTPWTDANQREARAVFSEVDLHARLDSDQTFDNIDRVFGASVATYLKDPISRLLSSRYLLNGLAKADEAFVAPLLILGYDYASEVKSESDPDARLDTSHGNHRARVTLYWSMPLGRQVDLSLIGISRKVDVDALFELNGTYDFRADDFLDQTRVSLNVTPRTGSTTRMIYTLSWERGKAAPTFKEVQALLAGLKVNF